MTELDSNFLNASCAVKIRIARAYLGAFWSRGECGGASGSVIGTLRYGAMVGIGDGSTLKDVSVVGIGDGTTLDDGAVVGIGYYPLGGDVFRALVGRYVASIPCRVFMACICSYPTVNGDAGAGLLSAYARSSTVWRTTSLDKCFGTGQLCGKNSTVLTIFYALVAGI